ncbi:MAG: HAMP domain-containing sensor histidine kinase [Tissierellia bacterium]|nr:HAMP domain-containing sensor histidine kinase [Tissierellia bacterium]
MLKKNKIFAMLLILSILSCGFGMYFVKNNVLQKEDRYIAKNNEILNYFNSRVNASFNNIPEDNDIIQNDDFINYDIEFQRIKNYVFTKEYYDRTGGNENDPDRDYFEKPEIKTYRNTSSFISQKDTKGIYTIKGRYDSDAVIIDKEYGDIEKKDQVYIDIFKYSLNSLTYDYAIGNDFDNNYIYNIKSADFTYKLDFNSDSFKSLNSNGIYFVKKLPNYFSAVVLFMIVTFILVFFVKYDVIKTYTFTNSIITIPVEFYIIIFSIIISLIKTTLPPRIFTYNSFTKIIGAYIFSALSIFFAYYASLLVKSLILERRDSVIIKNSIIAFFIRSIVKFFRSSWKNIIRRIKSFRIKGVEIAGISTSKVLLVIFLVGIFILWTIPDLIFIYIILAFVGYKLLKSVISDLDNINKISDKIVSGDYNAKIDTDTKYFKTIANNFNEIAENLDKAVEDRVKSERFKAELITNVSHDLKTPLTSIINYSNLIASENLPAEKRIEYSKVINKKSLKLKRLIEDLFEVSKINSNSIDVNLDKIDLCQFMIQIIGEWEDNLKAKSLEIKEDFDREQVFVMLDGENMFRVMDNLFSNISKYALENTRVYVKIIVTDRVYLEIKNISNKELDIDSKNLMERFVRGDVSRNIEGSGLGLSIAESLVEAQGGKFNIEIDGDLFKVVMSFNKLEEGGVAE